MRPGACLRPGTARYSTDLAVYPLPMNPTLPLPRSLWISVAGVLPAALLLALPLPESSVAQRPHVSAEQVRQK